MNEDRDVFLKIASDVFRRQNEVVEAVILDFVDTLDRWPTQRIDFVPPPFDRDARPPVFETAIDCLKWHRVVSRFSQLDFEIIIYFRLA